MTMALPVHYEPIAASAAIGSPFFAVPPLAHRGSAHPRLRRSRSNGQPSRTRPRHRCRLGAAHRRRTLASQQRMRLRFRPRSPACGRAARRRRALHRSAHRPRVLPLVPVMMSMATAHRRVRPPPRAAHPADGLHVPCERSAPAPSPMTTSATTPRRTSAPPRLNGSPSPSPTLVTIMAIGTLHRS